MKHITKICLCLLCVMSVFIYSSVSLAANPANVSIPSSVSVYLYLDDSYNPPTDSSDDSLGDYCIYKYSTTVLLYLNINSVDGYVNGNVRFTNSLNITVPNGFTSYGNDYEYTPINGEGYYVNFKYSTGLDPIPQWSGIQSRIIFYNYWVTTNLVNFAEVKVDTYLSVNKSNSNAYNPPTRISGTMYYLDSTNATDFNSIPVTGQGYGLVIKQAITDALHYGELDLVYDYLVLWKTTQDGYLADIELSVDDIETWLSYINSVQVSQDNKLDLIRQLLSTFPSYSSQMLNYMQQILAMNASQAAQAASNAAAQATQAQQASNAMAAANDFAKPDIGAMNIDPMDYVSADGFSGVSYILGSILNIPTILSMLLICVTCAFIGYALYGKKG